MGLNEITELCILTQATVPTFSFVHWMLFLVINKMPNALKNIYISGAAKLKFLEGAPHTTMSFPDDTEIFPPLYSPPSKNLCTKQWGAAASSED